MTPMVFNPLHGDIWRVAGVEWRCGDDAQVVGLLIAAPRAFRATSGAGQVLPEGHVGVVFAFGRDDYPVELSDVPVDLFHLVRLVSMPAVCQHVPGPHLFDAATPGSMPSAEALTLRR